MQIFLYPSQTVLSLNHSDVKPVPVPYQPVILFFHGKSIPVISHNQLNRTNLLYLSLFFCSPASFLEFFTYAWAFSSWEFTRKKCHLFDFTFLRGSNFGRDPQFCRESRWRPPRRTFSFHCKNIEWCVSFLRAGGWNPVGCTCGYLDVTRAVRNSCSHVLMASTGKGRLLRLRKGALFAM